MSEEGGGDARCPSSGLRRPIVFSGHPRPRRRVLETAEGGARRSYRAHGRVGFVLQLSIATPESFATLGTHRRSMFFTDCKISRQHRFPRRRSHPLVLARSLVPHCSGSGRELLRRWRPQKTQVRPFGAAFRARFRAVPRSVGSSKPARSRIEPDRSETLPREETSRCRC